MAGGLMALKPDKAGQKGKKPANTGVKSGAAANRRAASAASTRPKSGASTGTKSYSISGNGKRPNAAAPARKARTSPARTGARVKKRTVKGRRKAERFLTPGGAIVRDAIAVMLSAFGLFIAIALYIPPILDMPAPAGALGAALADFALLYVGWAAYLIPPAAFFAVAWLVSEFSEDYPRIAQYSAVAFAFAFLFAGIFGGAGETGRLITDFMATALGVFYPVFLAVAFLSALIVFFRIEIVRPAAEVAGAGVRGVGSAVSFISGSVRAALAVDEYDDDEGDFDEERERWLDDADEMEGEVSGEITIASADDGADENIEADDGCDEEFAVPDETNITIAEFEARSESGVSDEDLQFVVERDSGQVEFRFKTDEAPYELPPLSLLHDAPTAKNDRQDLLRKAGVIEKTLAEFKIDARVSHIQEGPRVTRFEIEIGPGINVSKIHNIADNLALELAVTAVRVEAPIPGKSAVGIEVPNQNFQLITLKSILDSPESKNARGITTVCLGRDIGGKPIVGNLAKMPHLLVAGATGSGKSVCLNTIIASLLLRATPDELKLVLIDPKWVELAVYKELPHLITPVVHSKSEIIGTFGWLIKEMERRYRELQAKGAKNISSYNAVVEREERLPYVIVIVDELADLFMIAGKLAEKQITRIAQKARAVGIHLVVATQRPDVKVITGTIKANIPSRIAFAVAQQVDSRTILDMNGAEKLLGEGDMLFNPIGAMKPARVQGAYVSDEEVNGIVEFICAQRKPQFNPEIEKMIKPESEDDDELVSGGEGGGPDGGDELYEEARQIVLTDKKCSISYLQRRLRIGYQRSARIVDSLVASGLVEEDPETGSYRIVGSGM